MSKPMQKVNWTFSRKEGLWRCNIHLQAPRHLDLFEIYDAYMKDQEDPDNLRIFLERQGVCFHGELVEVRPLVVTGLKSGRKFAIFVTKVH